MWLMGVNMSTKWQGLWTIPHTWSIPHLRVTPQSLMKVVTLHLELRSVMCIGAEENQAHCCDPYGLRVQEQPLFLVCSRIVFLLLWIKSHRSENSDAGADQKKVVPEPLERCRWLYRQNAFMILPTPVI